MLKSAVYPDRDAIRRDADASMFRVCAELLRPGLRVLDAGCGNGDTARRLLKESPRIALTLVDPLAAMLEHVSDLPGDALVADLSALPLADDQFDVIVSSWALGLERQPGDVVEELLRVLSPTGYLLYTFYSVPDGWFSELGTAALRSMAENVERPLDAETAPWHDCDRSMLSRFAGGLATLAVLRKCCSIGSELVPARGHARRWRFDAGYLETIELDSGQSITLRMIRPTDKAMLRRGFEHLSETSRYKRFLAPKTRLTDRELRYLTEVDGENHVAIGALDAKASGAESGVAIARFIRTDPGVAEPAIAIIDDWQRKGVGRVLFDRLARAARERGIETFQCLALGENHAVLNLIGSSNPLVETKPDGTGSLALAFPVASVIDDRIPELRRQALLELVTHSSPPRDHG